MILVTGASGRVGGQVVRQLGVRGAPVRAFVRDPASAPEGVDVAAGDLTRPETLATALSGVTAVFLLWPTGHDQRAAEVVALLGDRVDRVVYLSARGVDREADDDQLGPILASHRHIERLLDAAPVVATFVRGGGFASNTLSWASDIRGAGIVREPFGGIPRPLVHERDLAEVAVAVLTHQAAAGQAYTVTGPETVTGAEQVQAIADAIGRELTLQPLDRDEARRRLVDHGTDEATARSMIDTWAEMVTHPEQPTSDVERVTGHPATPFSQWARDHADDFR